MMLKPPLGAPSWRKLRGLPLALALLAAAAPIPVQGLPGESALQALLMQPADRQAHPQAGLLLAAARASGRIVAAGANGVILVSDDAGLSYRQASVPVRLTLTSLFFLDDRTGWATGHAGAILRTDDGGDSWTVQRVDFGSDQPLFSVYFLDRQEGWAVGLWSLMLHTRDGGRTWQRRELPAPPGQRRADFNLFSLFDDGHGTLFIACERGLVLRSADRGASWTYLETGYQGSFWSGTAWPDGTVLVAGLRGSVYRSDDGGSRWQASQPGLPSSITSLVRVGDAVYGAGLDGQWIASGNRGRTFEARQREDRRSITAMVPAAQGAMALFSPSGVVSRQPF